MIETTGYIRIPSEVSAVQVTLENMEELSKFMGRIKVNERTGKPCIQTDDRVPFVDVVYEGYWVTFMSKGRIRAYTSGYFARNFVVNDDRVREFIAEISPESSEEEAG